MLSILAADFVRLSGLLLKDRFEKKKDASREGLCWAWVPGIGVLGAEPRRHDVSYDVSENKYIILLVATMSAELLHYGFELKLGMT